MTSDPSFLGFYFPGCIVRCLWCNFSDSRLSAHRVEPGKWIENKTTVTCNKCRAKHLVVADGLKLIKDGLENMKGHYEG